MTAKRQIIKLNPAALPAYAKALCLAEIAAYTGLSVATLEGRRVRGQMPQALKESKTSKTFWSGYTASALAPNRLYWDRAVIVRWAESLVAAEEPTNGN